MRSVFVLQSLGAAALAAALLVACGGNSALAPVSDVRIPANPSTGAGTGGTSPGVGSLIGTGPTPIAPASPSYAPTPVPSASSLSGLPSPSPASTL